MLKFMFSFNNRVYIIKSTVTRMSMLKSYAIGIIGSSKSRELNQFNISKVAALASLRETDSTHHFYLTRPNKTFSEKDFEYLSTESVNSN